MSLSEHWFIPGTTGCGKTTFCRELVNTLRRSYPTASTYISDSKGVGDFAMYPGLVSGQDAPKAIKPGLVQVYSPPRNDLADYEEWFGNILAAKRPAIVLIDELHNIAPRPEKCPDNFAGLLKTGRGMGISVISCTQQVCRIPREAMGMATHVVRFHLVNPTDRRVINETIGRFRETLADPKPPEPSHKHGFFYKRIDDMDSPVHEYADFREFF